MSTDRPGSPDNPDRPTPDPAHPAESPSAPADPAHPGHAHYPLPDDPDAEPATPVGRNDPTVRFTTAEPGTPSEPPATGQPRGHEPTLALPTESAPDAAGTGGQSLAPQESGPQPTLPLPADFGAEHGATPHAPHHLAGEFHGGSGAFGRSGDAAPTAALGATPPPLLGGAAFVLPGPVVEPPEPALPAPVEDAPRRRGSITNQEAGITQPRPPTVAEARAREKARRRAEAQERAEAEAAEAKQRKKKRLLIGGAAVVGIAALVGGGYLVASAWNGPEVTAYCTVVANKGETVPTGAGQSVTATQDNQEIVVPDNYCSDATDHGDSGVHPGFFLLAGHSYRYYYGGSGTIGHAPTGGSTTAPTGSTVKTKSGSTIQRGGLGAKIHGGGS
ncbi:hypothetical protein [Nocardia niigatensis]